MTSKNLYDQKYANIQNRKNITLEMQHDRNMLHQRPHRIRTNLQLIIYIFWNISEFRYFSTTFPMTCMSEYARITV